MKNMCSRPEHDLAHGPHSSQGKRKEAFKKQQILEPYRAEIEYEQTQVDEAEAEGDSREEIPAGSR
jgi:hypothetical protein